MPASNHVSRRHFLEITGAAAATAAISAESYARVIGANDRIRVGFIGAGGMANAHMDTYNKIKEKNNVQAIAVADCWKTRAAAGAAKTGAEHTLTDYRKLLDIKDIDYVTIATPEHQHAHMTLDALDAGKAIYCEKPMTHTMSNRVGIDHLIRGYRGTLYFTPEGWVAKDKDGKVLGEHKKTGAEDTVLHHTNLQNHMRNGEELNCPVRLGLASTTAVVMANHSWRTGQMMGWDNENQKMVPCHTQKHNPYPEKEG